MAGYRINNAAKYVASQIMHDDIYSQIKSLFFFAPLLFTGGAFMLIIRKRILHAITAINPVLIQSLLTSPVKLRMFKTAEQVIRQTNAYGKYWDVFLILIPPGGPSGVISAVKPAYRLHR